MPRTPSDAVDRGAVFPTAFDTDARQEFDDSLLAMNARTCLPERQREIWLRAHRPPGWSTMRIAQLFRLSPRTIRRELAGARRALREYLEAQGESERFELTIAHSHDPKTVVNQTAELARKSMDRQERRRQRIPLGSVETGDPR
jgi:hypothetical protein